MTLTLPAALPRGAEIVDLDVRDDLKNRREPFARIMATVDALREGSVLHLRATFEPVPLFRVLGKKGFSHESRENGADDWSVWFWKSGGPAATQAETDTDNQRSTAGIQSTPNSTVLDVRGLEPPEPMILTLQALESMPQGNELVQVNERVPQFLLPVLTERGFTYDIDESHPSGVVVRIRRIS